MHGCCPLPESLAPKTAQLRNEYQKGLSIGVGKSQHPDPLQVVQGPLQVGIAHGLVTMIRNA